MADKKITQLTNITGANLVDADEFVVVDISADETKAITLGELKEAFDSGSGFVRITGDTMTGALDVQSTITADGLTVGDGTTGDHTIDLNGAGSSTSTTRIHFQGGGTGNPSTLLSHSASSKDFTISTGNLDAENTRFEVANNGDISFYEDTGTTAKFFWDASAESLGIGTTDPSSLDVAANDLVVGGGSGNKGITIFSGTTSTGGILFADGNDGTVAEYRGWMSYDHSTDALRFASASSERMRIDSSGNVLINTASHIPTDTELVVSSEYNASGTTDAGITLSARQGGNWRNSGIFANGDALTFTTGDTGVNGAISTSEKMRIDSSGNVGIGVTPSAWDVLPAIQVSTYGGLSAGGGYTRLSSNAYLSTYPNTWSYIATNTASLYEQAGGQHIWSNAASGTAGNTVSFSETMRIDGSGNLLVGKTTTNYNLTGVQAFGTGYLHATADISSGGQVVNINRKTSDGELINFRKDGTTVGSISSRSGSTSMLHLNPSSTNGAGIGGATKAILPTDHSALSDNNINLGSASFRFKDFYLSGDVFVNKTTKTASGSGIILDGNGFAYFVRNGGVQILLGNDDAGGTSQEAIRFVRNISDVGSIDTTSTATSYNTSSDYRLKTDVQPMTGATDRLKQLNPVNFQWVADGTRVDGFIAHEAQAVVPEAVTKTKNAMRDEEYEVTPAVLDDDGNVVTEAVMGTRSVPDYQGIDQSKLVPLLTAALQEALTKIDALETRITALEG